MSNEEQHLVEKARLLLQREREYFELLQKYERLSVWLALGQTLPELFTDRKATPVQLWERVRKLLIARLRLQRVVVIELCDEELRPLVPAAPPSPCSPELRAVLEAKPSGVCNDPETDAQGTFRGLAQALGLHRFFWSTLEIGATSRVLLGAGFDRNKAQFQAPFAENDGAFFRNTTQHLEFLAANAQLVAELEAEKALLERRVQERTSELAGKNQALRLVLDNVDQALVTCSLDGRLHPERSRAADRWFGAYDGRPSFLEHVQPDARFAGLFRLGLSAIQDDFLPLAVCLDQLPAELLARGRIYACRYLPIHEEGAVAALLIVIDDVTELRAGARAEAEQQELLACFTAFMRDRDGFLSFMEEAQQLLAQLDEPSAPASARKLALHTLKGSAATFGLAVIAAHCHQAENDFAEHGLWQSGMLDKLHERWHAIQNAWRELLPVGLQRTIQVTDDDLAAYSLRAGAGAPASVIVDSLRRLRAEPVERSLTRLGEQASRLAARLGRPNLRVEVASDDIRLDPSTWRPLWSVLLHVARNAVDHGIEPPEERSALGKSPSGRLTLMARNHEDGFRLELADDGRGIDWEQVRRTCERQGRPSTSRSALTEALFFPGFSTRQRVSETSGRGVGLSAVLSVVRDLGGTIELDSELGHGTRLSCTFPHEALSGQPAQHRA